jgi:uncharacterized protein YutE (UPF0331/DUF86 family)
MNEEKKTAALDALRKLHGDTSVDLRKTLESLEEIQSELEDMIGAVRQDIERG